MGAAWLASGAGAPRHTSGTYLVLCCSSLYASSLIMQRARTFKCMPQALVRGFCPTPGALWNVQAGCRPAVTTLRGQWAKVKSAASRVLDRLLKRLNRVASLRARPR